jgi:sec-independent protein translocase protein TatA
MATWIGSGLLQPSHLLFILLIVLILFGPGKLPDLGRGLGKGIREFKDALRGAAGGGEQKDSKKPKSSKGEEPVEAGASEA